MPKRKKRKSRIDKIDSDIFGTLYKAKRPLPIKKISERTDISWPTVNKHVKKLVYLEVLKKQIIKEREKVIINQIMLNRLKKKKKR